MQSDERLQVALPPVREVHESLRLAVAEIDVVAAATPLPVALAEAQTGLVGRPPRHPVQSWNRGRTSECETRAETVPVAPPTFAGSLITAAFHEVARGAGAGDGEGDAGGRDRVHESGFPRV